MDENYLSLDAPLQFNSSFSDLEGFWPYAAKMGRLAEVQAAISPERSLASLHSLGEAAVRALTRVYLGKEAAGSREQLDELMEKQRPCPDEIYDYLQALLRLRDADLPDAAAERRVIFGLSLAYSVCQWLEAVFAEAPKLAGFYEPPSYLAGSAGSLYTPESCAQYAENLRRQTAQCGEGLPAAFTSPKLDKSALRSLGQKTRPYQPLSADQRELLTALLLSLQVARENELFLSYAQSCNNVSVFDEITAVNGSSRDLSGLELSIVSEQDIFKPYRQSLAALPKFGSALIRAPKLEYNPDFLASLSESAEGRIIIEISSGSAILLRRVLPVKLYAYDQTAGWRCRPELISAYVMPNHPEIGKITADAVRLLEKWTKNPSLDGYQSGDPNRVLRMAAAVYGALQQQNIVYAVAPASFDFTGQRVRLPEVIMQRKMGNCMDLSLLYAACLEAIGLHPILICIREHMFTGVWLTDSIFPETVVSDPSQLTNRIAAGVDQIACAESTGFTAGQQTDFDSARRLAAQHLCSAAEFEYIIDVRRARLTGTLPMPSRVMTESGWKVERPRLRESELTSAPRQLLNPQLPNLSDAKAPLSKTVQWERKLLDLSKRNALVNLRLKGSLVALLTSSVDLLEDCLADGEEFQIRPRSSEMNIGASEKCFEEIIAAGEKFKKLLDEDFKNRRIYSDKTESELNRALKDLYRSYKNSLEENGANTLYLALGLVRWYDNERSQEANFAPILLLPVDIIRKSAAKGYTVRLRDDEPQLNITILEKFKQDFQLEIGGLDPLPLDEHGLDTRRIFSTVRYAVMGQPRWDVLETAAIGIFSFSQFVMWNDLRSRSQDLAKNKIVRSLMEGKLCWEADDIEVPPHLDPGEALLPISVDSSQLRAVQAANEGRSFVLHGPPGTGKSQTITALIANALAQGKTVLFVAEKMAALQVVHKRLKAMGIGPFCLELHSKTAQKTAVLAQLDQAANAARVEEPAAYAFKAGQLAELRARLDAYGRELHRRWPCGLSLYEMINIYADLPPAPEFVWDEPAVLQTLTAEQLGSYEPLIRRLILTAREIGHPQDHYFRNIRIEQYSRQTETEINELLPKWQEGCRTLWGAASALSMSLGTERPESLADFRALKDTCVSLLNWFEVPPEWLVQENSNYYLNELRKFAKQQLRSAELRRTLLQNWHEEFLKQDGQALQKELQENESKWLLARWSGGKTLQKKFQAWAKGDLKPEGLSSACKLLSELNGLEASLSQLTPQYAPGLGRLYLGDETDWQKVDSVADQVMHMLNQNADDPQISQLLYRHKDKPELRPLAEAYIKAFDALTPTCENGEMLLQCSFSDENWLHEQSELLQALSKHNGELKSWYFWCKAAAEAEAAGLRPLVQAYLQGLKHDEVLNSCRRSLYKTLILAVIEASPALEEFRGLFFNDLIEQFSRLDSEMTELTRKEIYYRLAANLPNLTREASKNSEIGILQKAIHSKGRGISLRTLFNRLPTLLHRLCPCMLMSPLSAAQYIDPGHKPFDLVVFDEASQMPTCKAVGVLARAEDAVIVGDPNQMPPTSFFASSTTDEDNLDLEDLESILDDCLALRMPQAHLLWHYRSRHESLIAFSNRQFYQNKLFTFPSDNARQSKVTAEYVNGVFYRGSRRNNPIEAQAVVEELRRRAGDPVLRLLSVGVVTFNISQQNAIDDLFNEARRTDAALESWAYEREEPLFIKNLENVQGDERDVIIFSIGYGPDDKGQISMNFGPLNKEGGWRRLNVAVSRARCEMKIFTSLLPEQIDTARTNAEGVKALKGFLEFAVSRRLPPSDSFSAAIQPRREEMCRLICGELQKYGYSTDTNVGASAYRLDIGVIDNNNPESYLLGILLDGPAYESAGSTRDRELGQKNVLQGLGWRLLRVWSLDWWENPQREINRILQRLQEAAREAEERAQNEERLRLEAELRMKNGLPVDAPSDEPSAPAAPPAELMAIPEFDLADCICHDFAPLGMSDPLDEADLSLIAPSGAGAPATASGYGKSVYQAADLPKEPLEANGIANGWHDDEIRLRTDMILAQEAPVSRELLQSRLVKSAGIARTNPRLKSYLDNILRTFDIAATVSENGREFLWAPGQVPEEYADFRVNGFDEDNKRSPEDICPEEYANAIVFVLQEQISLPEGDLGDEVRKLLGFSRTTEKLKQCFREALLYAGRQQRIAKNASGNWELC